MSTRLPQIGVLATDRLNLTSLQVSAGQLHGDRRYTVNGIRRRPDSDEPEVVVKR